ncbi:MAG TPA: hypothetical protein DIT25_02265 [Candidatus Moranbacteria bacterium]|nr:hypothetical protein [Candidatus Moranbacteria bacterium]
MIIASFAVWKNEKDKIAPQGSEHERLQAFQEWMEADPLLFSKTADLEKVKEAIVRLKETQNGFLAENGWQDQIFPMNFWEKFIDTSRQYADFEDSPSGANAEAVLVGMEEAARAYGEDLERLKNIITGFNSQNTKHVSLGGETHTTFKMMGDDLDLMDRNLEKIVEQVEKRKRCFFESVEFCEKPLKKFQKPIRSDRNESEPVILESALLGLDENKKYGGPYEINSPCWEKKEKQYLYSFRNCRNPKEYCVAELILATKKYYQKLSDNLPFDKLLKEKGGTLTHQSATSPYACNNLEYHPKAATLDYFYEKYRYESFFERLMDENRFASFPEEVRAAIMEGRGAEKSFFEARFPSEDRLEELFESYAYVSRLFSGSEFLSDKERDDLRTRYSLLDEKMANFDLIVNWIDLYFSRLDQKFPYLAEKNGVGKPFVYAFRSNYLLFFLNFSPIAWRIPEKPEYLLIGADIDASRSTVISREKALEMFGEEEIEKSLRLYEEAGSKHDFYKNNP